MKFEKYLNIDEVKTNDKEKQFNAKRKEFTKQKKRITDTLKVMANDVKYGDLTNKNDWTEINDALDKLWSLNL